MNLPKKSEPPMESPAKRTDGKADLAKVKVIEAVSSFSVLKTIIILSRAIIHKVQFRTRMKISGIMAE